MPVLFQPSGDFKVVVFHDTAGSVESSVNVSGVRRRLLAKTGAEASRAVPKLGVSYMSDWKAPAPTDQH